MSSAGVAGMERGLGGLRSGLAGLEPGVAQAKALCSSGERARGTIAEYRAFTRRAWHGGEGRKPWSRRGERGLHHRESCMRNGRGARAAAVGWRRGWVASQLAGACSNANVIECIREAAAKYGQPLGDALRVARCESGFSPTENYLGHIGVFQFLYPGTWNTTPYASKSVTSAKWNSLAAMWMWSVGRRGEWACT